MLISVMTYEDHVLLGSGINLDLGKHFNLIIGQTQ